MQDADTIKANLWTATKLIIEELRGRALPAVTLKKEIAFYEFSDTGGFYCEIAYVGDGRPSLWAWNDKFLDGENPALWFGFGCEYDKTALRGLIRDMTAPEKITQLTEVDVVQDHLWHLENPLPVDALALPILETYPEGWAEGFGVYQIPGERISAFVQRSVGFVEQVLRGLPPAPAAEAPSLEELYLRAMKAAGPLADEGQRARTYYRRSAEICAFVLARAKGVCEACNKEAPFQSSNETLYLEPHHIDRLSDGGPDDPHDVAAVCPNCHREAHHGVNKDNVNARARATVDKKMEELEGKIKKAAREADRLQILRD
jgi:hypothetical protein